MALSERLQKKAKRWEEESKFFYLDVIISSGEIRKLFFQRCKELDIDPYSLAMSANISVKSFRDNYVMTEVPHCSKTFPQEKFIKMLEMIGINVRVTISILSAEKAKENIKDHKIYKKNR